MLSGCVESVSVLCVIVVARVCGEGCVERACVERVC